MLVPLSVNDFIDRAVQVYGARVGVVDEPDQPAPSLGSPTYAELVKTRPVLEATLDALRIGLTPDELRSNVRGEANAETRFVTIRARDGDPSRAVALANSRRKLSSYPACSCSWPAPVASIASSAARCVAIRW